MDNLDGPQIDDKFKIEGDPEDNVYVLRGFDPISKRRWLCVEDGQYEGYNGDLVLGADDVIVMSDDRCSLHGKLVLTPVK